jgi:hypothetical protein
VTAIWATDMISTHIYVYSYSRRKERHSVHRTDESRYVRTMHKKEWFVPSERSREQSSQRDWNELHRYSHDISVMYRLQASFYFALGATVCIEVCHFQRLNVRFTNKKCFHSRIKETGSLSLNQNILSCHLHSAKSVLQPKQGFPSHYTLAQF